MHRSARAGSAVLVLDSPDNRNALSRHLVGQLGDHLAAAADDDRVRAVAVTATGGTFCSGADLSDPPVQDGPGSFASVLETLWAYPKPVVVAVNGHVRAGGLGLVASADLVVCCESASFAFTEVRLGLVPAIIAVPCLHRMPAAAASRWFLTGARFGPAEAAGAGLVDTVVADDALDAALDSALAEFGQCEPKALAATRALLRDIPGMGVPEGLRHARSVSEAFFGSPEAAEGIASFKEKRPPRWAAIP